MATSFSSIYSRENRRHFRTPCQNENCSGGGGPHSAAQAKKNNKKNIAGRNFFNIQHCGGHLTGHVMTVGEALQRDERRDAVEHVQNPNQDYLTFGSQQRFSASLSVWFHSSNTHRLIQSVRLSVRPSVRSSNFLFQI